MLGFLKRALGGGGGDDDREPEGAEPVEHEGFTIVATPRKATGGWSTEGRITKVVEGEAKEVHFIRADTSTSRRGRDHLVRQQGPQDHRRAGRAGVPE